MGMSASQARFLALTARKSNTEYQGQQINQQRTSLANESASLYRQLSSLSVPTPPSATDFYSMAYTFNLPTDTANVTNTIQTWAASSTGVGYDIEVKSTTADKGVKTPEMASGTVLTKTTDANGNIAYAINTRDANGNAVNSPLTESQTDASGSSNADAKSYTYQKNGYTYYIGQNMLNTIFDTTADSATYGLSTTRDGGVTTSKASINDSNKNTTQESFYKSSNSTGITTYTGVTMTSDANGMFTSMTYTKEDGTRNTVSVTVEEIQDEEGYQQAMERYNYEKMVYDREVEDMNNRTGNIQQQDKVLELNLKQLDTEQNAIQTEIDAVSKVIEKNIETSFKTFA